MLLLAIVATTCTCLYILVRAFRRRPQPDISQIVRSRSGEKRRSIVCHEYQLSQLKNGGEYYRQLFFKLHNIEQYPEIQTEARDLLISLLSEAITVSQPEGREDIFAIEDFTKEKLLSHIQKSHELVGEDYHRYFKSRRAGNLRLMVADRSQAAELLTNLAPLKLVDGAWLGHIHHVSTPFQLRPITKQAWQVLSEELGDGNLSLNHVHLYNKLLCEVGVHLPAPHERDFIKPSHGMNNENAWKAAVTQLLISLFPEEFLPEILGYNLHFEGLNMETMVLSRELQELKLDARYFLLHVSIDNMHSGHAMMAAHTVAEYMSHVTQRETPDTAATIWRRVQAGYALSAHQSGNIKKGLLTAPAPIRVHVPRPSVHEAEILRVLVAKAAVAQKIHSACRARIGGKSLTEWLDPEILKSESRKYRAIQELGNASPLIIKGHPQRSRLMQEIYRGGKMFGAFTLKEVKLFEDWIVSLGPHQQESEAYWRFTNRAQDSRQPVSLFHLSLPLVPDMSLQLDCLGACIDVNIFDMSLDLDVSQEDWPKVLTMWFAHLSLLECWVAVPSRVATPIGSVVVRILRAQYSFSREEDGVSGMDEIERSSPPDLVAIGLEIMYRTGTSPLPTSLSDVLARWPCSSAERLMSVSKYPAKNLEILLGMAAAFLLLQRAVAQSSNLLCERDRLALDGIIDRETQSLRAGYELFKGDVIKRRKVSRGYQIAKEMIRKAIARPV